jgi:hypothetical protein
MKSAAKKLHERNTLLSLYRKRDNALARVVDIWLKHEESEEDPDELNRALDALSFAHHTFTREWLS